MSSLLLWSIIIALFASGVAGIFIPALPGLALVFFGILFYALATDFTSLSAGTIILFGLATAVGLVADYFGGIIGARLGGGRKITMIGLVVGAVVGLAVAGPAGFVLGGVAGAFVGALYEGKTAQEASRAAVFSFLGNIGAQLFQLLLAIGMIVTFLVLVLL